MTLESQVCSLELAKRLKELGVKQESLFWWYQSSQMTRGKIFEGSTAPEQNWSVKIVWKLGDAVDEAEERCNHGDFYSAFTVAEIGQLLPWRSKRMDTVNNAELVFTKLHNGTDIFVCAYWDEDSDHLYGGMKVRFDDENEANSRAKMLIYLIENKLITL